MTFDANQSGFHNASQVFQVLSVRPISDDHAALDRILGEAHAEAGTNVGWRLSTASTLSSALRTLRQLRCPVVICERDLPLGDWKDLLEHTRQLTSPPLLIVASRHADDSLWAEALNLGAYDVLAKPFDRHETVRVIASACFRSRFDPKQTKR